MTGIDDLSHRIGGIEKDIQNIKDDIHRMIEIADAVRQINSDLKALSEGVARITLAIEDLDRRVTILEHSKTKLIGVAIGVSAVSGSVITWITKHFGGGA